MLLSMLANNVMGSLKFSSKLNPTSSSHTQPCSNSDHIGATQSRRYHHTVSIDRYIRELDQYNAWLGGQHCITSHRGEAMAQYVSNWECDWDRLSVARSPGKEENKSYGGDNHQCRRKFYGGAGWCDAGSECNEHSDQYGVQSKLP